MKPSALRGTCCRSGDSRIRCLPPLPTRYERCARTPGRSGPPRHLDAMGCGRVRRAGLRRSSARRARDLPQLRRRTPFRPRLFPTVESSLRLDSAISARACRRTRHRQHQADAFAALLDALDIDQIDVIGESAGATSALQLALRHPERVKHLAVLVGNLPGSPTAVVQPSCGEAIQPATPLVGAADFRAIDDGPAGGGAPERVRHES